MPFNFEGDPKYIDAALAELGLDHASKAGGGYDGVATMVRNDPSYQRFIRMITQACALDTPGMDAAAIVDGGEQKLLPLRCAILAADAILADVRAGLGIPAKK